MSTRRPVIYDTIGFYYNRHRAAEPSVVRSLVRLLDLPIGSVIADVGAGTGNYSNALAGHAYKLYAIEPSAVMRSQALRVENVQWLAGAAEALSLRDNSVDGVVCTLAIHHFGSLAKAASEISRICPSGPIVLLTIDPRLGEAFWFSEYFPSVYQRLFSTFPRIECVCTEFTKHGGFTSQVSVWLLPHNAVDITMHSGWNKPEIYLDQSHRQNMSGLALASRIEIESGSSALQAALASGAWDRDHGYLRKRREIDLGFRFVKFVR
jgi:ubiquinone/menaquinone biosynthesis C-methylase UbiE